MANDKSKTNDTAPDIQANMPYRSLAPTTEVENADEYISALSWAVKQKDIHNIAVSGPYGSGKSSVIQTFINNKDKKKIRISLASFKYAEDKSINEPNNADKQINTLEEEILKQIFYSVASSRIPRSRYRRINEVSWIYTIYLALVWMISLLAVCLVINYDRFKELVQASKSLPTIWSVIFSVITIGSIFALICILVKWFKESSGIREVSFLNKVEFKTNENESNSVFNKNMDEIVYFFEKTKTEIVVVEDLDRFNSPSIFSALRNLSMLLNNNEKIDGQIKFIYAIKDDLFKDSKERTKFFDFIIPIVPVVSSTNSDEVLRKLLEFDVEKNRSALYDISGSFITMVSPYLNDMRDIICVCNEFIVFKNTLKGNQQLDLDDEKMFSLIVFKNLYPKVFSELENEVEDNIVSKAFFDKQAYVSSEERIIEEYVTTETQKYDDIKSESLQKIKELKSALLHSLTNPPAAISEITIGGTPYSLNKILSDSFDVNLLKTKRITVRTPSGSRNIDDVEKIISSGNYFERIDRLKNGIDNCAEQVEQSIAEYKEKIRYIHSWSIKQVIDFCGIDFLEDSVRENDLLVFMLRNGFIDETYRYYINYFWPNSITKEEMNYILGIRNHKSNRDYSFPIINVEQVFGRLLDYEFSQTELLNFKMVDYVLVHKSNDPAVGYLMGQLSNQSDVSLDFIKSYIDRGIDVDVFVHLLSHYNKHLCKDILNDETVTLEKEYEYIGLLLQYLDDAIIISQDTSDSTCKPLTEFIIDNNDSLNRLNMVPADKLLSVIQGLDIVFFNNDLKNVDDRIKEYIFSNNKYGLNVYMLKQLFEWKRPDLIDVFNSQNYTSLVLLDYEPVLERVKNEFVEYISNVFLVIDTNIEEQSSAINTIIDALLPENYDLSLQVLEKCSTTWQDLSGCCSDSNKDYGDTKYQIWQYLFMNDRVLVSVENVMSYYDVYGFDKALELYFERHENVLLEKINDPVVTDDFKNSVLNSHISPEAFRSYILVADFEFEISSLEDIGMEKTRILVEEDILAYSEETWKKIHALWPKLCVKYAINNANDFLLSLDGITIDENTLIALLNYDAFSIDDRNRILTRFDVNDMTINGAVVLSKVKYVIPIEYSDSAWKLLDVEQRIHLLTNQMKNYTSSQLSTMIGELGEEYSSLVAGKKHQYSIPFSDDNEKLIKELLGYGYITSMKPKSKGNGDQATVITGYVKELST